MSIAYVQSCFNFFYLFDTDLGETPSSCWECHSISRNLCTHRIHTFGCVQHALTSIYAYIYNSFQKTFGNIFCMFQALTNTIPDHLLGKKRNGEEEKNSYTHYSAIEWLWIRYVFYEQFVIYCACGCWQTSDTAYVSFFTKLCVAFQDIFLYSPGKRLKASEAFYRLRRETSAINSAQSSDHSWW